MKRVPEKLSAKSVGLIVAAIVLHLTGSFYGVDEDKILAVVGTIWIVCLFIKPKNAALMIASLVIMQLLAVGLFELNSISSFFLKQPHSQLGYYDYDWGHNRYIPNQNISFTVPNGDLGDICLNDKPDAREVVFTTDNLGFRNINSPLKNDYILVGDSFVAGLGVSQKHLLTTILNQNHGISAYALAAPGDADHYYNMINHFDHLTENQSSKFILFFFEGNDFPEYRAGDGGAKKWPEGWEGAWSRYKNFYQRFVFWRATNLIATKFERYGTKDKRPPCLRLEAGDETVWFLNRYALEVVLRTSYVLHPKFGRLFSKFHDRIEHVFFIPAKFRVFYSSLGVHQLAQVEKVKKRYFDRNMAPLPKILPNANLESLVAGASKYGLKVTDLSQVLEVKSNGPNMFLSDDTHWSRYGIDQAALAVAEVLVKSGKD